MDFQKNQNFRHNQKAFMYVSTSFKWYDGIRMNMMKWKIGVFLVLLILFLLNLFQEVEGLGVKKDVIGYDG